MGAALRLVARDTCDLAAALALVGLRVRLRAEAAGALLAVGFLEVHPVSSGCTFLWIRFWKVLVC